MIISNMAGISMLSIQMVVPTLRKSWLKYLQVQRLFYCNLFRRQMTVTGQKKYAKFQKLHLAQIYQFLIERKALVQKADQVDNIIEKRNSSSLYCNGDNPLDPNVGDPIAYTRTLDKAYRFFCGWPCPEN